MDPAGRWRRGVGLARDVREHSVAARVAGVCQPGGSVGSTRDGWAGTPTEAGFTAPPSERRPATSRPSLGPRGSGRRARQLRLRRGAGSRRRASRRREPRGVHDLVGNGWEWTETSSSVSGFKRCPRIPKCSAEFFDGRHVVLKGASPPRRASWIRPSLRNWFRTNYPYVRKVPCRFAGESPGRSVIPEAPHRRVRRRGRARSAAHTEAASVATLYDALGSSLFDAICRLPWYAPDHAGRGQTASPARARHRSAVPGWLDEPTVVELGCGSGERSKSS